MKADNKAAAALEWKLGWSMVIAAIVGFSLNSVLVATSGLFMEPMGKEFGWNRTQLSVGLSISAIVSATLAPFVGSLLDRFGTRRLAIPGLCVCALSIASFSLTSGSMVQWFFLWLFYALASLFIMSTVWNAAVAGVFTAARGLAIGLTMTGSAIAQIFVPPIANVLIDDFGWRNAYLFLALGWGGIAVALNYFLLFDAHDRNKAALKAAPNEAPVIKVLTGLSKAQALRSLSLWKIALSALLIMLITIAVLVHQIPILTSAGVSRKDAAWLASLAGIAGIIGKLVTGWCMDRWHAKWVGGLTLSLSSVAFFMLLEQVRTPPLIVAAMFINGYASGSKLQICGYLTTRYAGLLNFGAIFGCIASVIAIGSGFGPVIGGLVFDAFDSYTPLLLGGIVGCLISGLLIFSLPPYPDFKEEGLPAQTPESTAPKPA